jgi:hypothetical protein
MRFLDHAFLLTVSVCLVGTVVGGTLVALSSNLRDFTIGLLHGRMLSPINTVSYFGTVSVFFLIFVNNCIPSALSFGYPLVILRLRWTPPLSERRNFLLLSGYTFLAAFLVGFFSLGAPLAVGWALGSTKTLFSLISGAWVHGPLEFAFVLVCVAEPLRIARLAREVAARRLFDDWGSLAVSIVGLLAPAAIEVFLRI